MSKLAGAPARPPLWHQRWLDWARANSSSARSTAAALGAVMAPAMLAPWVRAWATSTPVMVAKERLAPSKLVLATSAPSSMAPDRLASFRLAPDILAPFREQSVKSEANTEASLSWEPSRVAPAKLALSSWPSRVSWTREARPLDGCGMATWPTRKSAWVRSAWARFAPRRQAPRRSARTRRAPVRSALRRSQPNRMARSRLIPAIFAPSKIEAETSASVRLRPARSAPERSTNFRMARLPPGRPAMNFSWAETISSISPGESFLRPDKVMVIG